MRSDQVVQGFTQLGIGKLSKTHKRLHNLPGSLSHFLPVVLVKNFSLYLARTSLISVYSCFLSSPCHAWLWRAWLPPPSPLPVVTWLSVRCLWNPLCTRLDKSHWSSLPSWSNTPAFILLMASAELAPVCWCLCWTGATKVYAVL